MGCVAAAVGGWWRPEPNVQRAVAGGRRQRAIGGEQRWPAVGGGSGRLEYGLCEMPNREAIRFPPKDGEWGFDISELEAMLLTGTTDHAVERAYKQDCTGRTQIIVALFDKYPSANSLLVTHGEGVGMLVSAFLKDATVYEDEPFTAGKFGLLTDPGQTGISYLPSSWLSDGL
ncbi:hypothetical protein ACJRO7_018141 [Eucalyptus globulus]|uniref:Uncharacterized protein n=1 Tax=Eucalyptus globulus TaxID=34317 RepID=A0ABD3KSL1_EUCGL